MGCKRVWSCMMLALCALGTLSCNGSTPTTPAGDSSITLTVSVVNTAGQSTVEEAQAVMDGNLFIQSTSASPLSTLSLIGSEPLAPGTHTLTVIIVKQSVSPTTYTVQPTVAVMTATGTPLNTIIPPGQIISLATGAAATFSFSF